jgi:hypothetical protein
MAIEVLAALQLATDHLLPGAELKPIHAKN